jgi:hypothetical protein
MMDGVAAVQDIIGRQRTDYASHPIVGRAAGEQRRLCHDGCGVAQLRGARVSIAICYVVLAAFAIAVTLFLTSGALFGLELVGHSSYAVGSAPSLRERRAKSSSTLAISFWRRGF